jgi:hypothetical protein
MAAAEKTGAIAFYEGIGDRTVGLFMEKPL